jgi:hypothetical protein
MLSPPTHRQTELVLCILQLLRTSFFIVQGKTFSSLNFLARQPFAVASLRIQCVLRRRHFLENLWWHIGQQKQ